MMLQNLAPAGCSRRRVRQKSSLATILSIIAALVCLLAVIGPGLRWDLAYAPWVDEVWLTGPLFCEASRQIGAGQIPLLDWSTFETFHHNAHFTPVYPFYFLGLLNFCDVTSAVQSQDIIRFIHLAAMFANGLVLARVVGLSWPSAAFAATVLVTSQNTFALASFPTIIAPAAWLPLALAGFLLILHRRQHLVGSCVLVGSVTLLLYAAPGSNMIACMVFICMIWTGVWVVHTASREGARSLRVPLAVLAGCGALILLLNVGSTINLLLHMEDLIRWTRTGFVIGNSASNNLKEIMVEQRSYGDVPSLFLPEVKTYAAGALFTPAPVVVLALLGIACCRHRVINLALALTAALVLFFMFFDHFGWVRGLSRVPGLSHIRHLSLLGTPLSISLALLSGFGLMGLIETGARRPAWIAVAGSILACVCICLGLAFGWADTLSRPLGAQVTLATLVIIAVVAWLPRARWMAFLPVLLLPLSTASVFWHPQMRMAEVTDASLRSPTWKSIEAAVDRIKTISPQPGRIAIEQSIRGDELEYTSAGSIMIYKGLQTFQFYLSPRIYWKFVLENYRFPDYAFYALRGADWILAGTDLVDPALKLEFVSGAVRVYRVLQSRPWVGAICGALTEAAEAGRSQPGRLPDPPAALGQNAEAMWASQERDCAGNAISNIALEPTRNRLSWITQPDAPRQLVINLPAHRGWRLTVGGAPVPLFNLGGVQMLALLPEGASGVSRLTYVPRPYLARLAFSAGVAILAVIAAILLFRRRARRREAMASPS